MSVLLTRIKSMGLLSNKKLNDDIAQPRGKDGGMQCKYPLPFYKKLVHENIGVQNRTLKWKWKCAIFLQIQAPKFLIKFLSQRTSVDGVRFFGVSRLVCIIR